MSRIRLAMLALVAITLATAGCGKSAGSSTQATSGAPASLIQSSSSTQTGPLTRAELIAKADVICKRISTKRNLLKFRTAAQFTLILPQIAAYQHALLAELGKLTPPATMRTVWSQIVADTRTLAENTAKVNQYAQSNNATAVHPLFVTFAQARNQMRTTAKREGFKDCATY